MMEDLAMHLLELLMNSIRAGATHIHIVIADLASINQIMMEVEDDGKGMDEALLSTFADPFTTTRTTRKIGLGAPFMKGLTEICHGTWKVDSTVGKGTRIQATVQRDWIDTPQLGDLGVMIMSCIQADEKIRYELVYQTDDNSFVFDTEEIQQQLQDVPLNEPEILLWIRDYINEQINVVKGG